MRILHTSDWHIGRTLHGADLRESVNAFTSWFLDIVKQRQIDLVVISGDLFDRAVPPVEALHMVSDLFVQLSQLTHVIVISGNHDGPARLGFLSPLLTRGIDIVVDPLSIGTPIECGDKSGCLVYAIPYLEPDLVRQVLSDLPEDEQGTRPPLPRSHEAVITAALRRVRADLEHRRSRGDERPAILMIHAFLLGGTPSDSERDIEVGGTAAVRASVMNSLGGDGDVDLGLVYVAAGHLHRPQKISGARMPIRYSGSPIAYSFSEAGVTKSVVLLELSAHDCSIELLPIPIYRPIMVLKGQMADLLEPTHPQAREAYCSITVTDDARPENMVARLRAVYPHALVIVHESAALAHIPSGTQTPTRMPREVVKDFFETVSARPLSHEEHEILDHLWAHMRKEIYQ